MGLSLLGSTFISRLHPHCSHNFYVYTWVRVMQLLYMVVIIMMVMVMVVVIVMVIRVVVVNGRVCCGDGCHSNTPVRLAMDCKVNNCDSRKYLTA